MALPKNSLSVIVPVYMGEPFLAELYERVRDNVTEIFADFELILVNDASPDGSWQKILELCEADARVKGLNLSRNFGQHYAITAGLQHSTGEWVVVMDCDLQDDPAEIPNLFRKASEGYDSVFAQRINRQDGALKRMHSWAFYKIFSYLTDTKMDHRVANFGIYHRKVVDAILSMNDSVRYFPTMSQWVGFRRATLPVVHAERKVGTSSYSLPKLLRLAGLNMIAFSDKPLRLFVVVGLTLSLVSVGIALYYLALYLAGKIEVPGYASTILSVWFIGGMMMCSMGMVGIYVGRIFSQVKGRPHFVVAERVNLDDEE